MPSHDRPLTPRSGGRSGARPAGRQAGRRRGGRLRRTLKVLGLLVLVGVLLGAAGLALAYARTPIPQPNDAVFAETTTIYYADGTTVLGTFAAQDRTILEAEEIPDTIRQAVIAAEDRTFYDNPGISPTGIARAAWGIVTREPAGGGSTITQQYVKNYFLTSDQTVQRKLTEILIALKVEDRLSKDQILTDYLNTVYFGRGAYGIQAAAQAYFGVDAAELTLEQASLLAGVLPAPNRYDPAENPDRAQERFDYVTDGLVQAPDGPGWQALTQAEADALQQPETVERGVDQVYEGTRGYLLQAAREELTELGFTDDDIDAGGLQVVTTFDTAAQDAVEAAVAEEMPSPEDTGGEPLSPGLRVGAVLLDPATGGVRGMYGGDDLTQRRNSVTKDIAQAGSTFKPFTLLAALEQGVPLDETFNGNSGREFDGYDRPVTNFGDTDYGRVDLVDATADSVNTAYVELNLEVGPEATREAAVRAGLPENTAGLEDFVSNVLGAASPRVIDMAQAFSTLAAEGTRREWHVIDSVTSPNGAVSYEADVTGTQAFDPDVVSNATYALTQVVERGSGRSARELDRPVAGKTGTSSDALSAWFVGYTPQLVGAVALYQVGEDGTPETIDIPGTRTVTGGSYPTRIWTEMMGRALEGQPVTEFPEPADLEPRTEAPEPVEPVEPEPEPEPEPPVVTETVTEEPSPEPSPDPTPTPTATPEPSATATDGPDGADEDGTDDNGADANEDEGSEAAEPSGDPGGQGRPVVPSEVPVP